MDLRSALLGCSSGQLARIATTLRLQVEAGTLRRELVELVAERIVAAASDGPAWAGLNGVARQAVQLLVRAGGRHEAELLVRRLGRDTPPRDEVDGSSRSIERVVGSLVERGLLFRVFDAEEQRRGVYLVMPDELLVAAREHLGGVPAAGPPHQADPPERVARGDPAADLFVLASALRREAWSTAARGLAGRPGLTVGQIVGRLRALATDGPGDPGRRWRFLLWLGQRAGWISRDAWPTPVEDAIARLLEDPGALPSLALSAGPVSASSTMTTRPDEASGRRRQADALQLLSELDRERWWSVTELVGWLADELGEVPAPAASTRARAGRNRLADQLTRWLGGRWYWLGLLDWGWDGAAWSLVTPTAALRSLATGRPATDGPRPRPCTVAGRLELGAPPGGDLAGLFRAERYLAYAGEAGETRRYALTPASYDRGIRLDGDAAELRALLGRLLDGPVPTAWLDAIELWSGGSTRLTLGARLLLAADDEATFAEALAVQGVSAAVEERLSTRHAVVAGERVAALLADLARAGLPVDVDAGLRVEPADHGRSAALASGVAETAWVALEVLRRLAPDAVAEQRDLQAARARLDAVLAASVLESLNRRAATIVAAIAQRRRPRTRRRVV
jgi:hypothetical protein